MAKHLKLQIPDDVKAEADAKVRGLLEELKLLHIKEPPSGTAFNYIVDLYATWHGTSLYLCAKYACPSANAISPFFEQRFARIRYAGARRFDLAFIRHSGEWVELELGRELDECAKAIKEDPFYNP